MATADRHIGQLLDGRYRITRLVGRGGMGAVYEALHQGLDKRVAVKMLLTPAAEDQEAYARFLREARAASKLNHPHIVEVTDFSYSDTGEPFLVMEYLEGEDLHHTLRRERRLSLGRAAPMFQKVFSAMQVAHEGGIIHRDLKPQNIFLCRYANIHDFPKVLDFGISKILDAATTLTTPDSYIGTPQFMAPEQAEGLSLTADPRTDVFALGAILYLALTGEAPFTGDSPIAVFYNVVHHDPRPLRELCPEVPAAVEAVVRRALSKAPADRFPSVAELSAAFCGAAGLPDEAATTASATINGPAEAEALANTLASDKQVAFQSTLGGATGEKLDPPVSTEAVAGRVRTARRAWLALGGALVVLAALGLVALSTTGPDEPQRRVAASRPAPDASVPDARSPDASSGDAAAGPVSTGRADLGATRSRPAPKRATPRTRPRGRRVPPPGGAETPQHKQPPEEKDVDY